jgi:hypothetical protein
VTGLDGQLTVFGELLFVRAGAVGALLTVDAVAGIFALVATFGVDTAGLIALAVCVLRESPRR